ncbi:exosortase A [Citromicrobium bathyomarinum]|uniref:exosortase A n=1 Tax=Citromicrobium bathyomarinum TaxID=72174 RepID=UPI00315A9287
MPPELAQGLDRRSKAGAFKRLPAAWANSLGWLALAGFAALLLTSPQWIAMGHQWLTVSAYQHILFVPPIIGWLVWNRRTVLARMTPRAWWPGLALVIGALLLWLAGSLTSIDIVAQGAAVLLLQGVTIAIVGPRVGAVLAFPLAFAFFLVPFGEEIVPPLQALTAEMVIGLTHLSGIDATIDGVFIATPAGLFEVAAACAGVQFVVAMVTLGVLAAKVGMSRWPRRIAFMALCVIVPILANGVRAWAIVAVAQVVGAERAGGIDHIVYGWFFFAIVVALVMALGWRWFDRDPEAEGVASAAWARDPLIAALDSRHARASTMAPILVAAILLVGLWAGLARAGEASLPSLEAPEIGGWTLVETPQKPAWQPVGREAGERLHAIYRNPQGEEVDLYLAGYVGEADPTANAEGAVPPDTAWRYVTAVAVPSPLRGEELLAFGSERRLAWSSYVARGNATADPLAFRLAGLGDRLMLSAEPRWLVIISTASPSTAQAGDLLRRFNDESGGPAALVAAALSR